MSMSSEQDAASRPRTSAMHDALMQPWVCAFASVRVIYLSGPITTGPLFLEAIRSGVGDARERAFDANSAALKATAARLRNERSEIVVEPASLNVVGWSQNDYIAFWEIFIERHVRLVMLMPGWQFSAGCAAEFAKATESGIRTETLEGLELRPEQGIAMLQAAADDMKDGGRFEGIARLRASILETINRIDTALR